MSKKKPEENIRYEVITQEDPETGDILLPIPPILLEQLGWKEGDEIDFSIDDKGKWILKRVVK
jgi:hypothetical protein